MTEVRCGGLRTWTAKRAEIIRKGDTSGFELRLDGILFPWHIAREDAEVTCLYKHPTEPWNVLRIGIIVMGPVTGAEAFNEYLAEEADASRVRSADHRDMLNEGYPVLV